MNDTTCLLLRTIRTKTEVDSYNCKIVNNNVTLKCLFKSDKSY